MQNSPHLMRAVIDARQHDLAAAAERHRLVADARRGGCEPRAGWTARLRGAWGRRRPSYPVLAVDHPC